MKRFSQWILCLSFAVTAHAQTPPTPGAPNYQNVPSSLVPMPPGAPCPVVFFRHLLAMTPAERIQALTNRPSQLRARILAKVHEYQALAPDERELRLRATELRWYLVPLMRLPAEQRPARLAQVPPDLRDLVRQRLAEWNILPQPLQQEMLTNSQTLPYFAHVETSTEATTDTSHAKLADQFNQFFELTPAEKKKTLTMLAPAERAQMEKTLQSFEKMPRAQRLLCIRNYAKFTGMTLAERTEFLKNAARWSQMSPQERQVWRDLVNQVPQWPPMPLPAGTSRMTPMPPPLPSSSHAPLATNLN